MNLNIKTKSKITLGKETIMRTFIALDLSKEVKRELEINHQVIKNNCSRYRITNTGNLHITLKFLGEISSDKLVQIKHIMDDLGSSNSIFGLCLSKWGSFKSKRGKIIWVGLDGDLIKLNDLAKQCHNNLSAIVNDKKDFNFKPHITIVRDAIINKELKEWHKLKKVQFKVKHLNLYESVFNNRKVSYVSRYKVDLAK